MSLTNTEDQTRFPVGDFVIDPVITFAHGFSHPDRGVMTIDKAIQLYAWHGIHHTAHITGLRKRKGW